MSQHETLKAGAKGEIVFWPNWLYLCEVEISDKFKLCWVAGRNGQQGKSPEFDQAATIFEESTIIEVKSTQKIMTSIVVAKWFGF